MNSHRRAPVNKCSEIIVALRFWIVSWYFFSFTTVVSFVLIVRCSFIYGPQIRWPSISVSLHSNKSFTSVMSNLSHWSFRFFVFFFFFQTDALRFCRCSSDLMGHRRVVFSLTETLLIFRGWFVRPTAGRLADVGPIRQTCLCLSEMRQRLHLESESPASLKHWLRITTYVLLQILRLQNQQKGHTLQAYETRALANSSLASLYLCPPTYPPFLQPFTRFQTKRSFLVRMDVETWKVFKSERQEDH